MKQKKGRIHLIADYKQKWLPLKHLEKQSDAFGKRGKSIFGVAAFKWDEKSGEFSVLNIRVAADDSNQNWYHSMVVLGTALDIVVQLWDDVDEASLQSDGAGNNI